LTRKTGLFSQMTTLTDMEVLGELGWTSQAIYEYSGGLVPKFWRPPYVSQRPLRRPNESSARWTDSQPFLRQGDADNRVRAIAEEVFGMILVGWNRDSNDWCLNDGPG
jgi:chitin deacetylase